MPELPSVLGHFLHVTLVRQEALILVKEHYHTYCRRIYRRPRSDGILVDARYF